MLNPQEIEPIVAHPDGQDAGAAAPLPATGTRSGPSPLPGRNGIPRWNPQKGEWPPWLLGLLLALAVCLVYSNSFAGPFQYDDAHDIRDNLSIRRLWPLRDIFFVPGQGFMSRPIANLSFALNYATGGFDTFHFHLTNLAIHVGAALAFLGVLRRTLVLPVFRGTFGAAIPTLSLVTAAAWALHPLLTESVSYITQRYESLMGLFVMLTFYAVVRMAGSSTPNRWALLGSISCLFALGSKEVAVSVPILVLLFDRIFLADSFREAWRKRWVLYLGLLVAWACFFYVQTHTAGRVFAGFGLTTPWWRYALNQPPVILHYLRLAVWPYPLNFDYYWPVATTVRELAPGLAIIGGLLGLTLWSLVKRPMLGFLSLSFFFILAPTSSVMPILDLAVEHRMYLPLAPLIVLLVMTAHHAVTAGPLRDLSPRIKQFCLLILVAGILSAFGTLTYLRNEDYKNPIDLWRDAAEKSPKNPRAHHNHAFALAEAGYIELATKAYRRALELAPEAPLFHTNFGVFLGKIKKHEESLEHLRLAVKLEPGNYKNYLNLGIGHWQKGSLDNAITCFLGALEVDPNAAKAYSLLGMAKMDKSQLDDSRKALAKAIELDSLNPSYRYQFGLVMLKLNDSKRADAAFKDAIRLDGIPDAMIADIGWAYHGNGQDRLAVPLLRQALAMKPDRRNSRIRLAWILATSPEDPLRNGPEALELVRSVMALQSVYPAELLDILAVSLAESGRFPEARAALQLALSGSKDRSEPWVPGIESRLALFERNLPYRHQVAEGGPR